MYITQSVASHVGLSLFYLGFDLSAIHLNDIILIFPELFIGGDDFR
jgi:hypothetical protein